MRCERCGSEAFERFRGRIYCRECFIVKYNGTIESCIRRYRMIKEGEQVLAAVSGGKDSVAMLSVLKSLSEKMSFELSALFIDLGIGEYSIKSENVVKSLCRNCGVELHTARLEDYGFTINDISGKICSVCGNVKRYVMNRFARKNKFDVIATGHCGEDILSNFLKNLYSGNIQWSEKQKPRLDGYDRMVTRIRPLYEMSEKENMLYVLAKELPFIEDECPHAPSTTWKEIVYEIEKKIPGFRISVLRNLARERRNGDWAYRYCRICGEITSSDICQFCRNVAKYSRNQ